MPSRIFAAWGILVREGDRMGLPNRSGRGATRGREDNDLGKRHKTDLALDGRRGSAKPRRSAQADAVLAARKAAGFWLTLERGGIDNAESGVGAGRTSVTSGAPVPVRLRHRSLPIRSSRMPTDELPTDLPREPILGYRLVKQ